MSLTTEIKNSMYFPKMVVHNPCSGFSGNGCNNMLPKPEIYRCKKCFHEFNLAHPSPLELS